MPEYLDRPPLPLQPAASAASLRSSIPARGGARSSAGLSARSGSASHLSRSRSSQGLLLSNATVRLVEHPLAWKLHQNGINVRTPFGQQPAGVNAIRTPTSARLAQSASTSVLLPPPARMAARAPSGDDASEASDDATEIEARLAAQMPPAAPSRPMTPGPLCATFGLHPAFTPQRTAR